MENNKQHQLTPMNFFDNFTISRYRFQLVVEPGHSLPEYPAVTLRGLLGWSLQKTVCPFLRQKKTECAQCFVRADCPYFNLYEHKATLPGCAEAPKGYMLYSPPRPEGRTLELELSLFGKCNDFLPAVVEALFACGSKGLGHDRDRFQIVSCQELTPTGYTELSVSNAGFKQAHGSFLLKEYLEKAGDFEKITFVTPLRLRKKGKYLSKIDWPFFYSTLARRMEALNQIYGDGSSFGRENWLAINSEFRHWPLPSGMLRWHDLNRYSSRQQKKIPLGGLVGTVYIGNINYSQKLWLTVASLINVGKGVVMGLGHLRLS